MANSKREYLRIALVIQIAMALICLFWFFTITTKAQIVSSDSQSTNTQVKTETQKPVALMPVWKNYKEVTLGMTGDEVKDKLGKAEVADKDGFYYKFSETEAAQIVLDADKKVRAISIIYKVEDGTPPKLEDILGAGTTAEPNANGAVYQLVRYPEAGYWVAYSRTAGDNAMVTVTIQKL